MDYTPFCKQCAIRKCESKGVVNGKQRYRGRCERCRRLFPWETPGQVA